MSSMNIIIAVLKMQFLWIADFVLLTVTLIFVGFHSNTSAVYNSSQTNCRLHIRLHSNTRPEVIKSLFAGSRPLKSYPVSYEELLTTERTSVPSASFVNYVLTTEQRMSAVRQRLCTHNKTASFTSSCPWWRAVVAALLASMFLLGDACEERQFLNSTSGACQQCTRCGQLGLQPVQACNATNDAVCERCPNPNEYYAIALMGCTLDCALCPRGCPKGKEGECDCSFDKCLTGIMCDVNTCTPDPPTTETPSITSPTTTSPPTQPVVLPHWGIALVSIGVILGIVLFSALFVLLGLFTSRRRGQHDDFNSNSSSNMKCGSLADRLSYSNGGTSSSLISLYTQSNSPAFQNYQLSLKQGSSHSNFGSWNNIKCSPKTQRSSSVTMTKPRDGFLTPV